MIIDKLKGLVKKYSTLFANFSYITLMQVFILLAPLITYPYLVKVLGTELYGYILSAQMLASYASLVIDFGSNSVCAKHVSINRNNNVKLSEIVNSVLIVRLLLFIACFFVYMGVVIIIPQYRPYWLLFLLTYGWTLNDLLYPQYFFQGTERMKTITIINISTKLLFILLVFVVVKGMDDYLLVPILYTIGYTVGGVVSLLIIYGELGLRFYIPKKEQMIVYVKDSSAVYATDMITTIKDKVNYMLVGMFAGMQNVVIYDLGFKFISILTKPMNIISIVMFPRSAKNHNVNNIKKILCVSFTIAVVLVILLNIFMKPLAFFFLHEYVDLLPIRLLSIAPIFLSVSSIISSNVFVAWGYNKYVFYSILITTAGYLFTLLILILSNTISSIYSFAFLAVLSYLIEFIYRLLKMKTVFVLESSFK